VRKFFNLLIRHKWFALSLILAVLLALFRFSHGIVQQDNYLGYATSLARGLKDISFFDSRLFPGLPILIYLTAFLVKNYYLAGYFITLLSFAGSYFLLYKITNSTLSILPLIFPPVMLNQASLVATEMPAIFLVLLCLYLFKKQKFALSILVSAFGFWIRPVAIIPAVVIFIYLLMKNKRRAVKYLPFFLLPIVLLFLFNLNFFGSNDLFHQFTAYRTLGVGTLGIIQIFADIPRSLRWGWYRIFVSGIFYFSLAALLLTGALVEIKKKADVFIKIVAFTLLASLLFIFSFNSVPFLENLGRYLAPTMPLFWIIFHKNLKIGKWAYLLLPASLLIVLL
jgi:hypothetical protein